MYKLTVYIEREEVTSHQRTAALEYAHVLGKRHETILSTWKVMHKHNYDEVLKPHSHVVKQ